MQIEKSQGEIYRLRAKLESTQTENENMHDELEKMQQALNRSYADRDKIASDLEKMRDELERSQVCITLVYNFKTYSSMSIENDSYIPFFRQPLANINCRMKRLNNHWTKRRMNLTGSKKSLNGQLTTREG